jgi:hypothetical protein
VSSHGGMFAGACMFSLIGRDLLPGGGAFERANRGVIPKADDVDDRSHHAQTPQ